MAGLCMYGVSALLLVLALKHGELSMIYPVIALTFVWVTIVSAVVIGEPMTPYKLAGIATIVAGVGVLGLGKRA
jgi:multidrug transporter EmrE-like cation transporter